MRRGGASGGAAGAADPDTGRTWRRTTSLFLSLARTTLKWDEPTAPVEDRRAAATTSGTAGLASYLFATKEGHILFNTGHARFRPDDRRIDADARPRRQGHQDCDQRSRPPGSRGGVRLFQEAVPSICTTPSVLRTPPDSSVQLGPRTPRQETFTTTAVMRTQNDGAVRGRPRVHRRNCRLRSVLESTNPSIHQHVFLGGQR